MAKKDLMKTDENLYKEIAEMMERANELSEEKKYDQSIQLGLKAWEMLPVKKEEWDLVWYALSLIRWKKRMIAFIKHTAMGKIGHLKNDRKSI